MTKILKQIILLSSLVAILILPYFVFAQSSALKELQNVGTGDGTSGPYQTATEATAGDIAASIITIFLGLLGIIFLGLLIYGGYKYLMARGNQDQVEEAMSTIRRAIIGLLIITAAYAITFYIFSKLPGGSGIEASSGGVQTSN
jgi:cytochrome bd-type quinol oxidase subunit 2